MLWNVFCNENVLIFLPVGSRSTVEDDLLRRLEQTGATESSSTYSWANQMVEQRQATVEKAKCIMQNIVAAINNLWCLKDGLHAAVLTKLPGDDGIMFAAYDYLLVVFLSHLLAF